MSDSSWQEGTHWYAVHTKPRMEHAVQDMLESRGIETYLPVLKDSRQRTSAARRGRAFFARYMFAWLNLANVPLSSINWSPGVTRVVSFGGQPAIVPDEVVDRLRERLAATDVSDYYQGLPLRPGDRMRVSKGPLRDMEAAFDQRLSSGDRARVLIQVLGRLTSCEMDLSCLERI